MEENKQEQRNYGLFNGRRSADQYVKGWLKGVALISGTGLTVLLSFGGWSAHKIYDHERRLERIETTKFTSIDAAALLASVRDELQAIKIELAKIPAYSDPPIWMQDIVKQHAIDIRDLKQEVSTRRYRS